VVILSRRILGIGLLVAWVLGTHPALAQVRLATAGERTDESCLADNIYFEAAHEALAGARALPLPDDVRFYHATYIRPRWTNQHEIVTRIGRHIFYR
jgi:spore germination cell wall hydrolase CwlJ-like protein